MQAVASVPAGNYPIHEIANIPRAFNAHAYNKLSAQEEGLRKRADGTQESIDVVDSVKTIAMDAVKRIFEKQLEILNALISQKPEERNFAAVPLQLEEKLNQLYKEIFKDYVNKIEEKEFIIEDGVEITLTQEKEEALKKECRKSLDEIFKDPKNIFTIGSQVNLEFVKAEIESQLKTKNEMQQRVVSHITTLENTLFGLQKEARKVFKIREKYFALVADDFHTAAELGDMQVLTNCVKKIGWLESTYKAINQMNSLGFYPQHIAAFHNQLEVLRKLLENKADILLCDKLGYQPLHWAAKRGLIPIATLLLEKKAPVNGKGAYGRTPLHMAVFNSHEVMTIFLLEKGADINAQTGPDDQSKTPLHDAVIHQDAKMVNCLINNGSLNVTICDSNGRSPFWHAVYDGNIEIALVLSTHKSWKVSQNPQDPNHLDNILKLKPLKNEEKMMEFLRALRKSSLG